MHRGGAANAQYSLCARITERPPKILKIFTRNTETTVDGLRALLLFPVMDVTGLCACIIRNMHMSQHCFMHFLPSAANQGCLSPQFISNRPVLREDAPLITNTSIFLAWDISAPLPEFWVFSIPSFTYMLEYRLRTNDIEPLFQTVGITRG